MNHQCPGNPIRKTIATDVMAKTLRHPCYSAEAHKKYARMHLPVAPSCNIQCNYCNRKFDCSNESRPGVTSEVLTPETARMKYLWVKENIENLSVAGIAGPGDALADWATTRHTIQLIQAADPAVIVCLSTNGLMLPELAAEIVGMGIRHVTVTANAVDPEIGSRVYRSVTFRGHTYHGTEAAELLMACQQEGIRLLAAAGVLVKVNMVMIKGVNDSHIPAVVDKARELGAFMTNILPMIPVAGSAFGHLPATPPEEVAAMRERCQTNMQQMKHCKQCRADAIGLLGKDRSQEFRLPANKAEAATG